MAQKKTLAEHYRSAVSKGRKGKKTATLDEFCHTTSYNRKYAITLLRHTGKTQLRRMGNNMVKVKITAHNRRKRACHKLYDKPVEQAVLVIWDFFRHVCGKRLVPMIRANLKALAREFRIPADVQAKLAKVSRSTIERMLGRERKRHTAKGKSATRPGTLLKQQIPVRTFWHWDDKKAGFCEIDTVSHDGGFIRDEKILQSGRLSSENLGTSWRDEGPGWQEGRDRDPKQPLSLPPPLPDTCDAGPYPLPLSSPKGGPASRSRCQGEIRPDIHRSP
jgi:hypothetical protein